MRLISQLACLSDILKTLCALQLLLIYHVVNDSRIRTFSFWSTKGQIVFLHRGDKHGCSVDMQRYFQMLSTLVSHEE